MSSHADQLRKMLDQVAPPGRPDGLKESLEKKAGGESSSVLEGQRVNAASIEAEMVLESLDVIRRRDDVDSEQTFALEAIIMPYYRPVVDIVDDYIRTDQLSNKWHALGAEALKPMIRKIVRSVGRLNVPTLPSLPYAGTAFVVGDGLLMTNRHVARIFSRSRGAHQVEFLPEQTAQIGFYHESGRQSAESVVVEKVLMIHPWWDMAILKVTNLASDRVPLRMSAADPRSLQGREVVTIGYPGYDPNGDDEFQRVQSRIFRNLYYVKRFQPGVYQTLQNVAFGAEPTVMAVTHDCSTLGGNSGSAVVDQGDCTMVGVIG